MRQPVTDQGIAARAGAAAIGFIVVVLVFGMGVFNDAPNRDSGKSNSSKARKQNESKKLQMDLFAAATAKVGEIEDSNNGKLAFAVAVSDTDEPIIGGTDKDSRAAMLNLANPVAAVAAVKAGETPSQNLRSAISDAITKTSACGERRVTVGLQKLTNPDLTNSTAARNAFEQVLSQAGVTPDSSTPATGKLASGTNSSTPDGCWQYLRNYSVDGQKETTDIALFGERKWSVSDAAKFQSALAIGAFGESGRKVYSDMVLPKQRDEPDPNPSTPPGWGAGKALSEWPTAYQSAWGSSQRDSSSFQVTQMASFQLGPLNNKKWVTVAVRFTPAEDGSAINGKLDKSPRSVVAIQSLFEAIAAKAKAVSGAN